MTWRWLTNIVFPALVVLCIAPAWAYEETTMQNFLVKEGSLVSVSNIQGKVIVEGHAENVVNMTATKSVEGVSEEKARELLSLAEIKTEIEENALRITTDLLGTLWSSFLTWHTPKVDYLLAVPYGAQISVETVSGEVGITNPKNRTGVRTVSGNITVQGPAGKTNLETVSGKIAVGRLMGDITVQTISGDVEVDIPFSNDFLEVSISSVSGSVLIFIHEQDKIKLSVETVSGRFASEIPLEIHEGGSLGRRTFQGQSDDEPRKTVWVKTISGNVSIKKSGKKSV